MYDNPKTLKELCIDFVCNNEYLLIDHNGFLPMEVSETILTQLSIQNKLDDETLSYFNKKNVNIRSVVLHETKNITPKGLRILKNHKIKKIEVHSLKYPVNVLVDSLSKWSIKNLESLSVSNITFGMLNSSRDLVSESFSKLKNLRSLDVSDSGFSNQHLSFVLKDLPHLESLNISNTNVNSFMPFGMIENKLQILSAYNLKGALQNMKHFAPLKLLTSLTHLDLSFDTQFKPFSYKTLLTDTDWLPNLVALDISGSENIGPEILGKFLTTHQKLRFLGLMKMNDCELDMFTNPSHPLFNPDLVVPGYVNVEQLLTGLKFYIKRPFFIHDCLSYLFRKTENCNSPKVEIIQLILNVMHYHSDNFLVQTAATACLYNLTKLDLSTKLHPSILGKILEATLYAMEHFSNITQLQRNTLLILCNGSILINVKMDRFKCAKLVLDTLNLINDDVLNPMSIIIFCTLAPKMSYCEVYHLEYYSEYILILLTTLTKKVPTGTVDLTMRLILSALSCLTGESTITCKVFIDNGGLKIYLDILNKYMYDSTVDFKVLSLLKNIAEIPYLRAMLLINGFISPLRQLLRSEQIVVSYCAAGIVAHLACESSWETYTGENKFEVLEELKLAIKKWVPPEIELVALKSFKSFIGLLNLTDSPQVQFWAAWAIHHACTHNGNKYCAMLNEEVGVIIFQNIVSDKSVDQELRKLCNCIMAMMNKLG